MDIGLPSLVPMIDRVAQGLRHLEDLRSVFKVWWYTRVVSIWFGRKSEEIFYAVFQYYSVPGHSIHSIHGYC